MVSVRPPPMSMRMLWLTPVTFLAHICLARSAISCVLVLPAIHLPMQGWEQVTRGGL
jgi:hypothetical protein